MNYRPNNLKDEEVVSLKYLVKETLLHSFNKTSYEGIKDVELNNFINDSDIANSKTKPISLTVIKGVFGLFNSDTGYRPKYSSLDFLVQAHLKENMSFKEYLEDNEIPLEDFTKELDYIVKTINPKKKSSSLVKNIQTIELGSNSPFQINLTNEYVNKLLVSVTQVVGDLISKEILKEPKLLREFHNKRISNRLVLKEDRRQKNIENIIAKAIKIKKRENVDEKPVDSDWITDFFNASQDFSDEKMQVLWAKLLAGEVEKPGRFSKRTIHRIKMMTQHEALVFNVICRCIWKFNDQYAGDEMMLILEDHYYKGYVFEELFGFELDELDHLENLGLLKLSYIELVKGDQFTVSFFGKEHVIGTKSKPFDLGYAGLTKTGEEIFSLIDVEPLDDYYEKCFNFFKKENILFE